jgi:peptidoglycan-N-acetylglucosamine deacetylase
MSPLLLLLLLSSGPKNVAVPDRTLWKEPLATPAGFDTASRAEILVALQQLALVEKEDLPAFLGLKKEKVVTASVDAWKKRTRKVLAENFAAASKGCSAQKDVACPGKALGAEELGVFATNFDQGLPDPLRPWYADAKAFHRTYLYEQLRLAALFPSPTSEALAYSDDEITGFELPDRTFMLTFDDGPAPKGKTTDALLAALRKTKVNGTFFMLGDALDARLKATSPEEVRALYEGECVASHGRVHESHQKKPDWQDSITFTDDLIRKTFPAVAEKTVLFRPPYGQRKKELAAFLAGKRSREMLWNLDSQDWNAKIDAAQVTARMESLILLWRRGILLFHDVHEKAPVAIPALVQAFGPAATWADCARPPP